MTKKYNSVLIIGMGLIGSSISRALVEKRVANSVYGLDSDNKIIEKCYDLNLLVQGETNLKYFDLQFDLIIICTPLSAYKKIFSSLSEFISQPTLITDVGSTKMSTISDFKKVVTNNNITFVPSHPIAGLEKSGPEYGFSTLFENRYCVATPFNKDDDFVKVICKFWEEIGMFLVHPFVHF